MFTALTDSSNNLVLCPAGLWVGDCFIYNNSAWRLNYCVGGEVTTMFHLDRPMYLLGYLASQSKVYLIDKVALFNPESSSCIRKRHPYTGNLNSETSEDSKNAFLYCGDVAGVT